VRLDAQRISSDLMAWGKVRGGGFGEDSGASVGSLGWNGELGASPIGQTGVGGYEMPLGFSPNPYRPAQFGISVSGKMIER